MALSFVTLPVLVGQLGSEAFGLILLSYSVMGYFGLFSLGIPGGVAKFVAQHHALQEFEELDSVIATSILAFLVLGIVVAGGVVTFIGLNGLQLFNIPTERMDQASCIVLIAAAFAAITWPGGVIANVLEGFQQYQPLNFVRGTFQVVGSLTAIAFAMMHLGIEWVFVAMNSGELFSVVGYFLLLKWFYPNWRFRLTDCQWFTFRRIFGLSVWLLVGQLAVLLTYQTDYLIIASTLPIAMLTVYQVVMQPFKIVQQCAGMLCSAIMPAVSRANATDDGRETIKRFLFRGMRLHNNLVMPMAAIAGILSEPFIRLWMGEEFVKHAWIASVACYFQVVWQSLGMLGSIASGVGRFRAMAIIGLAAAIVNAGISLILVQYMGVAGVVLGTVLAGALSVALMYMFVLPAFIPSIWQFFVSVPMRPLVITSVFAISISVSWGGTLALIDSWGLLIVWAVIISTSCYGLIWFLGLSRCDREWLVASIIRAILPGTQS